MFSDPVKNLRAFALRENNIVADLGAGTGYYSVAAGHMVPMGKVYAVEIIKDFLGTIKNKVREAHLSNVECIWGNVEKAGGTKIGDKIVDAAIVSNLLFQVEHKDKFIEETKRILKPGGRVLLIDWSSDPSLSATAIKLRTYIPKERARAMFESKGFKLEREINAGLHHYGMILVKT